MTIPELRQTLKSQEEILRRLADLLREARTQGRFKEYEFYDTWKKAESIMDDIWRAYMHLGIKEKELKGVV